MPVAPISVASSTPATANAASPSAGGGYAVQLTSQRSEADAQSAFRSLQAKYPNQLGGREPILRRADLGAKGVYYRALVGPFASMEEAAGVCSSLKAAGGNCIVQKN
jgi:cell division septation protein DedD